MSNTPSLETVEPFTPYADSLMWRVHHAYFAQRGAAVWTEREIPSQGTSNLPQAREHVRLLKTIAPTEGEVRVLEVGSGAGDFAANFMEALRRDAPELLPRVRFHLSDYVVRTVEEAARRPAIAPWVASGHIIPIVFDVARPLAPKDLTMVIANYVCCAIAMRPLQKWGDDWREPWVETRAEVTGPIDTFVAELLGDATRPHRLDALETHYEWRETTLEGALGSPLHAAIARRATTRWHAATLFHPVVYLDFLLALGPSLAEHGVIVTNDYGFVEAERLSGLHERRPESFANCIGQEVQFAIFDAFAAETGWALHRDHDPLAEIHRAIVAPRPLKPGLFRALGQRQAFGRPDWQHLLDFQAAAKELERAGDRDRALRFWLRCAELDPTYPDFRYAIGDNAIDADLSGLAREHLLIGLELDPESHDWEFMLGRAAVGSGDIEDARQWYKRALARQPDATTHVNLAALALEDEDFGTAYRHAERALTLDPEHTRAEALLEELRERVWDQAVTHFRDELPVVTDDDEDGPAA